MAEEDEAAAKAAAKRAKKLKQKAKKQQGQQSLSPSEEDSFSPDTASKPEGSSSQGGSHSSDVSHFVFTLYLPVCGVEPVVTHQISWLESTGALHDMRS